jgi:predicted Zn-dependent protease with MMP-like domain
MASRLPTPDAAKRGVRWVVDMDSLRQILRAAAIAAFSVGLLLMLLNPPSLSGFGGLVTLIVAAVAFVLFVGWMTVMLMGRQDMSEQEFDRLVMRSEELAKHPLQAEEATEFELLVAEAIDRLPPEFQELLEDTAVVVSRRGASEGAYGHYFGGNFTRGDYEHRIVLYQDTLERDFGHDPELLRAQVERTLRHELAHHLGWREQGVRDLGL